MKKEKLTVLKDPALVEKDSSCVVTNKEGKKVTIRECQEGIIKIDETKDNTNE